MKKILTLILALVLCLGALTACVGGNGGENNNGSGKGAIDAAVTYLFNMYKDEPAATSASFVRVTKLPPIDGENFTVAWSVNNDKITITDNGDGTVTIGVPKADEAFEYVLTATVSDANGNSKTKDFKHNVPKYEVNGWDDYMAAAKGDTVFVEGIVVAINSKSTGSKRNHLFLADASGKGGYYSYQMDQDPIADLGIKVGMTVAVTGPIEPYGGMQEIKGGTAEIIDSTIKTYAPVDITEVVTGEDVYKNLQQYVALPVTIKGVEIGAQDLDNANSQYLYFTIGNYTSYLRTYLTDLPDPLGEADKAAMDAAHAEKLGYLANVTGILVFYNETSPYLIPTSVDCFEYLGLPERSDAEKVELEVGNIKVPTNFNADSEFTLPLAGTTYDAVKFTWTSDNAAVAIATDGKVTVTVPNEKLTVTLTLNAACGEATSTKTYTLTLNKTATPIAEVITIGSAKEHNAFTTDKYLVAGVITEIASDVYGNMYIVDGNGDKVYVYGLYSADGATRYDAMTTKPVVGDYIVVLSVIGKYNDAVQLKNAWVQSVTPATSVKDAIALGQSKEHNTYTEDKYLVTGVITEVYNTQYGNMKITDAEGNILTVYGTYSADGATRYDALAKKPVVGDTVTVYGIVGQYSGTSQVKNGWIVGLVAGEGTTTPETPTTPDAPSADTGAVKPVPGTAYKFAMYQGKNAAYYYLKGGMNGYYMDTTATYADAIDLFVEETTGGYYLYIMNGTTKTYINMVVSGTHVNGAYEAAATTVYTYDETLKTFKAVVDGSDYIFGTRSDNTYTTVGPVKVSNNPFYAQFVTAEPKAPTTGGNTDGGNTGADTSDAASTITFDSTSKRTVFTAEQQVWVDGGITVTNDQSASTSPVADYSKPARFYKNSKLTVAYTSAMTKIVFNCNTAAYATALAAAISGATVSVSGTAVTVTLSAAANSFVIEALSGGQVRVDSIAVYTK